MARHVDRRTGFVASLCFWGLVAFLVVLWIAGGASRADVLGQPLVRATAWLLLAASIILIPRWDWKRYRPIVLILGCSIALVALQLVTLPPSMWSALPGRQLLLLSANVVGEPQPWRPVSLSPSATANALHSLVVPLTVLVLASQLRREHYYRLVPVILLLIFAGSLIGLLQVSQIRWDNPLINDAPGSVSGNFANRNHFALFVAIGALLTPVWAVRPGAKPWEALAAIGVVVYLGMVLLAIGSRMGMLLGFVGFLAGLGIAGRRSWQLINEMPRKYAVPIFAAAGLVGLGALVLSVTSGRAVAVDRLLNAAEGGDIRTQALPVVLEMIGKYFPVGSGFGAFDPVYRISEPDGLLQRFYLNHAHNDWLEVVLDGGVGAIALLVGALAWFAIASWRAWVARRPLEDLPRAGSAILVLVMLASVVDYPARTPMIMAIMVLAGVWLCGAGRASTGSGSAKKASI